MQTPLSGETMRKTYRENSEASPQGGADTYRWNVVPTLTRNKVFTLLAECSKIQLLSPAWNAIISWYKYLTAQKT